MEEIAVNRPIEIEGVISQASDIEPKIISLTLECISCGADFKIPQIKEITLPNLCAMKIFQEL